MSCNLRQDLTFKFADAFLVCFHKTRQLLICSLFASSGWSYKHKVAASAELHITNNENNHDLSLENCIFMCCRPNRSNVKWSGLCRVPLKPLKTFLLPILATFHWPDPAKIISGQFPVVTKVDIIKVHQSGAQGSQHSGPVPYAVVSIWSCHNVPHHNGFHSLLLGTDTQDR